MGKNTGSNSKKLQSPKSASSFKGKSPSKLKKKNKNTRENIFVNSPIYELFRTFEKAPNQWAARYLIILAGIILKSAIGLGSFSGKGEKPINGDFEAQRHWMELTIHLPIEKWYYFDLQYWGLDYPPLTAFHSYFFGQIGSMINFSWFALNDSRGLETSGLKNFMRISSLLSDVLIFMPALLQLISILGKKFNLSRMDQIMFSSLMMYLPSLNLIDHGHFQFNSVMLGLFLFSITELIRENYIIASIWFIMSINFKQMGLYYAPFIFVYIFASLFENKSSFKSLIISFNFKKLFLLSLTILMTQFCILFPFLTSKRNFQDRVDILKQIVFRVFPFQRGLFEDKVGNFWSVSNILIKYNKIFSLPQLTRLSLVFTLLSLVPSNLVLFYKYLFKTKFSANEKLISIIYGFAATAWSFYLFSFQVHEKSVLVPLLPSTLLYLLKDRHHISIIQWVNNAAIFSLYPLLKKDGLVLQYLINLFLSNWLIGGFNIKDNFLVTNKSLLWNCIFASSYIFMSAYHFIDCFYTPPARYPDLWIICNTTISFACFSLFWLWLLYRIYKL